MNSKDFVIWFRGFIEGCHEYAPTPKQWDILKDKLSLVKDREDTEEDEWKDWMYNASTVNTTYPSNYEIKYAVEEKEKKQLND